MSAKFLLNQNDNYKANFGEVYRSSSIFYYISSPSKRVKTELSFMNYWEIKNNLTVSIIANIRTLEGKLLKREKVSFNDGEVFNFSPFSNEEFEGSVEFEIFSIQNMRFPYPAIMVSYIGNSHSTMTHSYARIYSQHEIEDSKIVPVGYESCWAVKDNDKFKSFCVFHNGNEVCEEQDVSLTLKKYGSLEERSKTIKLPALRPFETVKIYPSDHFENISNFLDGVVGNVSIDFKLKNAFTRMLVGHENVEDGSLQVTHSNFNYRKINTNLLEGAEAVFIPPMLENVDCYNVIIYPDFTEGEYIVQNGEMTDVIKSGEISKLPVSGGERLKFLSKDISSIPSRLVLGIEFGKANWHLGECSLNIFHSEKPFKRFHWGSFIVGQNIESRLIFTDIREFFGEVEQESEFVLRFYSQKNKGYIERKFSGKDIEKLSSEGFLITSDDEILDFVGSGTSWWSIFSEYGGLFPYVMVQDNKRKSITVEHAF